HQSLHLETQRLGGVHPRRWPWSWSTVSHRRPKPPRAARHFVQAALDDLDPDICDVVMLLTSELATNAMVHARTDFEVTVARGEAPLRIAVTDGNTRLPQPCMAPADA